MTSTAAARVVFFGQSGPYAPIALRALLAQPRNFRVALVVEGRKVPIARATHRWSKPNGTGISGTGLADLALQHGIETLQTCDVNAPYVSEALQERKFDALFCVGFDRLFVPDILRCAALCVNAHPSELPLLRGPAPLFWSLRQGQRLTAVTLHALDKREDHGPIYSQVPLSLPRQASGEELYRLAGETAAQMFVELMQRWQGGTLRGTSQPHARASRAPRPKPEDAFVEPATWTCAHLLDFACGAPYFQTPWMRFDEHVFSVRRGLRCSLGKRLPASFVVYGSTLAVQCADGIAFVEIQI